MAKHMRKQKPSRFDETAPIKPEFRCRKCFQTVRILMTRNEMQQHIYDLATVDEIWPNKPEAEKNMLKYNLCPDCFQKAI